MVRGDRGRGWQGPEIRLSPFRTDVEGRTRTCTYTRNQAFLVRVLIDQNGPRI